MLKSNFLLTALLLLLVCVPSFAQDDDGKKVKKEKKVKVKKDKVKKEKVKKEKSAPDEAGSDSSSFDDDYPYPEVRDAEYSDFIKPKHQEQQDKFLDDKYMYPAPPKNQWEIGLDLGPLWISGDVKTSLFPGLGIGGHVRKSFGYVFSLRGSIMGGVTKGANWQGSQGWSAYAGNDSQGSNESIYATGNDDFSPNEALSGSARYAALSEGDRAPDYRGLNDNIVFYNYRTRLWEGVISGVVNLNNIKFHKRRNNWAWHGFAGVGGLIYNAKMDQLGDGGQEYNYSSIAESYAREEGAKDIKDALKDLRDGEYESQAEKHHDDYWFFGSSRDGDHEWSYRPTAHVGLGTQYKITNMINLGFETKVTYTNDDLLDGQRWQEWGALTRDYDTYVWSNLSLNVNLGAKNSVEPLWWMNPLDYGYDEMKECNCEIPEPVDLSDCDNDGVPDLWDLEKCESREECPVDTHGVELDSDGDGIKDCDDCQPHTPRHLIDKISECGEAFDDPCPDCPHTHLDSDIISTVQPCDDSYLPNILFNNGSAKVRDEFQPQLQAVADYLRQDRNRKICVVGHTDSAGSSRANDCISYKRAQAVIDELVSKYGIPRDQLILQYRGSNEPVIGGVDPYARKKGIDAANALNRRVDFRCCEGSYDMPRPSGCK